MFLAFGPFWKYAEACGPVIFFLVFTSIFLHLLVSNCFWHFAHFQNARKHAIRLYIFSRFHERFWYFAHFRNAQRHVVRSYFFSFSRAFLVFCPFSKRTEACDPVIFFLVFMSVFGILLIFEMHRCMSSGHIFSRFHERFWYFAHFRNAQMHVVRSYFFSFS